MVLLKISLIKSIFADIIVNNSLGLVFLIIISIILPYFIIFLSFGHFTDPFSHFFNVIVMETSRGSSDGEDIPSDFFDDFNKEEFMEGLSVIDSWDPGENKPSTSRSRINAETIDSVQDLRELIGDSQNEKKKYDKYEETSKQYQRRILSDNQRGSKDHSGSASRMDEYIKPGSRRDPSKTNKAIKKDKEVKVKEYLAKHLESSDDIRPPGTELDEFFDDRLVDEDLEKDSDNLKVLSARKGSNNISPSRERRISPSCRYRRESPMRHRVSPQRYRRTNWSPRRPHYNDVYRSPYRSPRRSPHRNYSSPHGNFKRFHKYSPPKPNFQFRREHRSRSPYKSFQRRSRSPRPIREYHRSRSRSYRPEREDYRRSRSNSSSYKVTRDDFHYQNSSYPNPVKVDMMYQGEPLPQYSGPVPQFSGNVPNYPYTPAPAYSGYTIPFEYGSLPVMPVPQPVPAPSISLLPSESTPLQTPTMVPAPIKMISPVATTCVTPQLINTGNNAPMDPLAQMVADGKLSHEDYLKLAPNKGCNQSMDNSIKEEVLHRCYSAISKLGSMVLPNRLIINNNLFGPEIKQITPKFCSPLKRQVDLEFQFSKFNPSVTTQQNKQIVDSIVATLSLEKIVGITKKKVKKDSKDVGVQTSKPFCDMCVIRESTKCNNVGTSIDREHFSKAVHTQVVDQDLVSSQSVFNPSGSVTDGATFSIAHMTPAQLVSQLAARAKTLKQTEPQSSNQYRRNNYDQDSRGQYRHNYNYRY